MHVEAAHSDVHKKVLQVPCPDDHQFLTYMHCAVELNRELNLASTVMKSNDCVIVNECLSVRRTEIKSHVAARLSVYLSETQHLLEWIYEISAPLLQVTSGNSTQVRMSPIQLVLLVQEK